MIGGQTARLVVRRGMHVAWSSRHGRRSDSETGIFTKHSLIISAEMEPLDCRYLCPSHNAYTIRARKNIGKIPSRHITSVNFMQRLSGYNHCSSITPALCFKEESPKPQIHAHKEAEKFNSSISIVQRGVHAR